MGNFSRATIIAAAQVLKSLGHSNFKLFLLELGLDGTQVGAGSSLQERANSLAKFAIDSPTSVMATGQSVEHAVIHRAARLLLERSNPVGSADTTDRAFLDRLLDDGCTIEEFATGFFGNDRAFQPSGRADERSDNPRIPREKEDKVIRRSSGNKVFVVHGHDDSALQSVARFIEKLGLEAIILKERPAGGGTIIEKFEQNASAVAFAVVILTPDDLMNEADKGAPRRVRQNVLFELGYFAGKLGRSKTLLLKKGNIEIPSDLYGVSYEDLDLHDGWKLKVARELKAAGVEALWDRMIS